MLQRKASSFVIVGILIIVATVTIFPFLWMVLGSVKTSSELFAVPMKMLPTIPQWSNFTRIFDSVPFALFYWNTAKIAVLATVGQVFACAFSGYAFSKLNFPGRDKLFILYLATLMIPSQVTMIPQYEMLNQLGLLNTHMAIIILRWFSPFGVFLLRQFFVTIPDSLIEAARIDGAGEARIFFRFMLPLSKSAIATLVTLTFLSAWNEFLGPLIFLNDRNKFTLQIGIRYFQQEFGTEYTLIMGATTLSLIPILIIYIFAQKYFIEGIASSGLKG